MATQNTTGPIPKQAQQLVKQIHAETTKQVAAANRAHECSTRLMESIGNGGGAAVTPPATAKGPAGRAR